MNTTAHFVSDFREAAPYINYLRGKTLVIGVSSSLLQGAHLSRLATDLNLLASLGIRLVLIHGAKKQIHEFSQQQNHTPQYHANHLITDEVMLQQAKQASGILRNNIEAALYSSLSQSPQRNKPLSIISGNFLSARPLGIIDGIDMMHTGVVRKIDTQAICQSLDNGALVLISPLGHSLSGKTFSLSMKDIAEATAIALQAEKLIYITEQDGILDSDGQLITNLSAQEAREQCQQSSCSSAQKQLLHHAIKAVENGVKRTQILSGRQDGSLIRELFTREGAGTSIAQNAFVTIREAQSNDIPHIIDMIRPLEEQGILLRRSREYLENHIQSFFVLEHDQHIYGCVALKTFSQHPNIAELACLVVSTQAQEGGYGELLLSYLLKQARNNHIQYLFALSTHTGDWFIERGFQTATLEELPQERQTDYRESGRNSQIFVYHL